MSVICVYEDNGIILCTRRRHYAICFQVCTVCCLRFCPAVCRNVPKLQRRRQEICTVTQTCEIKTQVQAWGFSVGILSTRNFSRKVSYLVCAGDMPSKTWTELHVWHKAQPIRRWNYESVT